jgi:hypothetical protein
MLARIFSWHRICLIRPQIEIHGHECIKQRERLDPPLQKYINRVYYLKHDEVKDMTEMDALLDEKTKQSIKHFLEDHDLEDKFINAVGIEKMIEKFGLEKIAETIGIDKLKQLVDEMEHKKDK